MDNSLPSTEIPATEDMPQLGDDGQIYSVLPTTPAAVTEESPPQSIDLDHPPARLSKTTSAQDDQLQDTFPSHFPRIQHVQNHEELGFYVDRSQYVARIGSGPIKDLQYGIIIVPFGEEHMLFRSEYVFVEVPIANPQKASIQAVEPGNNNSSVSPRIQQDSAAQATARKAQVPLKKKRNGRDNSSQITKTAKTTKATKTRPHPQTPASHPRRRARLNAGHRMSSFQRSARPADVTRTGLRECPH